MTSSQVGKTEIMNNVLGYFLHHDPCPILVLQPTLEMARAWSVDRLVPMISSTPAIKELIGEPKSKDGDNTILQKAFRNGARLSIAGSNSPASLASRPIRILLMDECQVGQRQGSEDGDLCLQTVRGHMERRSAAAGSETRTLDSDCGVSRNSWVLFKRPGITLDDDGRTGP